MTRKPIDMLSDRNPQLFRELKGRLNPRNLAIAAGVSLVGQLILLLSFFQQLPHPENYYRTYYCTKNGEYECLKDAAGNAIVNWQLWWIDIFLWLSFIGIFGLLVAGTYMLISDLAREERRGTLNFIRVSPSSTLTIFQGKLLGVPALLYVAIALAVPLHLWAGINAQIPFPQILVFDLVLSASCFFFYGAAMLFGIATTGLGGFQAWLGSGSVLMFLAFTSIRLEHYSSPRIIGNNPSDWLNLFSPTILLPHLIHPLASSVDSVSDYFCYSFLESLEWFYYPVGASVVAVAGLMVLNFSLWTYWIWQGLERRFPNPGATILSKGQSYALAACFQAMVWGFALQNNLEKFPSFESFVEDLNWMLALDMGLLLGLIAILSPHRQTLQDWARYKLQIPKAKNQGTILKTDTIWGEKSPATIAIALNILFTSALLVGWISLWPADADKVGGFVSLLLFATVILFCALVAQLMLLMKTSKRGMWAASAIAAAILLPTIVLPLLSISSGSSGGWLWLFTAFSWVAISDMSVTTTTVAIAILSQWLLLVGLNFKLNRQLRRAGESATKALLSGRIN